MELTSTRKEVEDYRRSGKKWTVILSLKGMMKQGMIPQLINRLFDEDILLY
ncbi:MAG: hypothetical protein GY950_11235 [bacterium]|nr:hypothetical protein [bacterium]